MTYKHPVYGNRGLREMTIKEIEEREEWGKEHENDSVPVQTTEERMQMQIDMLEKKLDKMSAAMKITV